MSSTAVSYPNPPETAPNPSSQAARNPSSAKHPVQIAALPRAGRPRPHPSGRARDLKQRGARSPGRCCDLCGFHTRESPCPETRMLRRQPRVRRLSGVMTVSTSKRPRPLVRSCRGLRSRLGPRSTLAPASDSRRKCPEHARRADKTPIKSTSQPCARRNARSPRVDLVPGRITTSASPGMAWPGASMVSRTFGRLRQRVHIIEIRDPTDSRRHTI